MGTIYLHRNKLNGKCYVGQTIASVAAINSARWCNGRGYDSKSLFGMAILKYGWNNFEHIILKEEVPVEELNHWEIYYIDYFHSYVRDEAGGGYNATKGGETSKYTWELSEDIWLKTNYDPQIARQELYNRFITQFPKTLHTKAAVFARLKTLRLSTADNINYWTEEEIALLQEVYSVLPKLQLLEAFPGRSLEALRTKAKQLGLTRQVDCNSKYSQKELDIIRKYYTLYGLDYCAKLLPNRSAQSIKDKANKVLHLKHNIKFTESAGFDLEAFREYYAVHSIKETAEYFSLSETQITNLASRVGAIRSKETIKTGSVPQAVVCVELNQQFESAAAAGKILNLGGAWKSILACCQGKRKTAGGYHWKFLEKQKS